MQHRTCGSTVVVMMVFFITVGYGLAAQVPDTGQTKCYDDTGNVIACPQPDEPFYGQDGNYLIDPPSYTKLDGGGNALPDSATSWVMVRDNITGLVWEVKQDKDGVENYADPHDADNTYTWYDGSIATNPGVQGDGTDTEDFIAALNAASFGGYSDWRLPTVMELESIVDLSRHDPSIDTAFFANTQTSLYWSSNTRAIETPYAWYMNFTSGTASYNYQSYGYCVRAVRGGQTQAHFTDNGDGTLTDSATGLMWQQQTASGTFSWSQALSYCQGLNLAGHGDWRLPTRKELRSIADYGRYNPSLDPTAFPDAQPSNYWSSTTCADSAANAWCLYFYHGGDAEGGKSEFYNVRAVRGGQSTPSPTIVSTAIEGPATVSENSMAAYSLTAEYSDGTSGTVTSGIAWTVDSPNASIATDGTLTVFAVDSDQTVTITATYESLTDTYMITLENGSQKEPEQIMPQAVYQFEEGDRPTGSVALGDGLTVTFAGDIEVGVIDNHPGFYLGSRPVPSLMAAAAAPGEAANLSFTFEEPIQAFTVLAADYDGNTTISAYGSSGQVVENVAVTGATPATYALTWEQPIAKIVISGTSGWVGTTEALAVILGQILSQPDGGAVQGVTITITPSGRQATSDRNGNYTLTGIKPGTYSLTGTGQNIATVTVSGLTVSAGSTVTQDLLATVAQGAGSDPTAGWNVTADLWAKAVLEVSGGPVALVWQEVGADMTPSGDQVISGYFYADPADFAYGSPYNPELFVKIYIAANGWCNMAFNHVTVDPVTVFSAHQYGGTADQTGSATLENRLLQHEFTGVAIDPGKQSAGGQSGTASSAGYPLGSALWSQAVLQVPGNPVTLVWKEVGTDTTPSGARVVSGYFYADPADFAYGSVYNPEVFVKVYIDPTGWANMAFNHVTVDPVAIDSAHEYAGAPQQSGSVVLDSRLLEHSYTGVPVQ